MKASTRIDPERALRTRAGDRMSRATTAQRHTIVNLLREAEYDPRTVTLMHRRLGVSDCWLYRPVDEWLDSLTVESASALIDKLQREVA